MRREGEPRPEVPHQLGLVRRGAVEHLWHVADNPHSARYIAKRLDNDPRSNMPYRKQRNEEHWIANGEV